MTEKQKFHSTWSLFLVFLSIFSWFLSLWSSSQVSELGVLFWDNNPSKAPMNSTFSSSNPPPMRDCLDSHPPKMDLCLSAPLYLPHLPILVEMVRWTLGPQGMTTKLPSPALQNDNPCLLLLSWIQPSSIGFDPSVVSSSLLWLTGAELEKLLRQIFINQRFGLRPSPAIAMGHDLTSRLYLNMADLG